MKKVTGHGFIIKSLFLMLLSLSSAWGTEKLILFGGHGYTPEAAAKFVDWAGGKEANILILPWASDDPTYEFEEVESVLSDYHPKQMIRGYSPDEKSFNKTEIMAQIDSATGIFIPGGDQVDLMERINQDPEIRQAILKSYHNGVVYAGFSAGTAAASKTMITGRGDETKIDPSESAIAEGLGLVTQFIVDQHFIARKRQNRLMSALMKSEEKLAVGIDEATALVVEDGVKGTVFGASYVMLFRKLNSEREFAISLLKNGDTVYLQ